MNYYTKLCVCSFEHTSSSYVKRRYNWSGTFPAILTLHLCYDETLTPTISLIL